MWVRETILDTVPRLLGITFFVSAFVIYAAFDWMAIYKRNFLRRFMSAIIIGIVLTACMVFVWGVPSMILYYDLDAVLTGYNIP